jgi:hypothetical protein
MIFFIGLKREQNSLVIIFPFPIKISFKTNLLTLPVKPIIFIFILPF